MNVQPMGTAARAAHYRVVAYMRKLVWLGVYVALICWRFSWDQALLLMPILLMFGVMHTANDKLAQTLQLLGLDGIAKEFKRRLGDQDSGGGTVH